ncbi:helix-turn-helix transcriptional regulator [Blautia schinkii]|nr:helix-turn-helix transcriptional regulator [Blautia schinkii]
MKGTEIFDPFTWSESKKIITADHHHISGLANITYCTISSADFAALHYHSDIIEIHCIVKGQRTILVSEDGIMNEYTALGNELMLTYPFELHETGNHTKNRNEYYAIQISVRKDISLLGLNEEYSAQLRNELKALPNRHLKVGHTQISMLRTAWNFFTLGPQPDFYTGSAYLICFLQNLKYLEPAIKINKKHIYNPMQNVFTFINENIDKKIMLQELADISGYSLSHFKFIFKESFGITPAEYISLQKINYAEKELLNSDVSITELAHKLSFSSSNYFCSVFKKILGITPSEYRKMKC